MMGAFRNASETGFEPDDAAIVSGFERLSRAFPQLTYWEIDNEYEYHLRDKGLDVEDYKRALRAAATGLRSAGHAGLVPNGTAGVRLGLTEALLEPDVADAIWVVNSHVYTQSEPLELGASDVPDGAGLSLSALDQLRLVSYMAHRAGKQSWLTEIGWDVTNGPAVGERLQAEYLPRALLLARWAGMDKVFWFYDRDTPDSAIRFSTCGLLRADGSVRPSGIAMATLSAQTARSELLGDLDLGDDIWALVLRQPGGALTIAAWTVEADHPLPEPLRSATALDMLGNPVTPEALTPEVTYFALPALPEAWAKQLQARWASAPVLKACPSQALELELLIADGEVFWGELPAGVASGDWSRDGDLRRGELVISPEMTTGRYVVVVSARGDGWQKTWRVPLLVETALAVSCAGTYEPNQAEALAVTSPLASAHVTVRLDGDAGTVAPQSFSLLQGRVQRVAVVPSPEATGTVRVGFTTDGGAKQEVLLRPLQVTVPLSEQTGSAQGVGERLQCATPSGQESGLLEARLGRTEDGLLVSAEMPSPYLVAGKPEAFWECTNVELFVQPSEAAGGWTASCRHYWLTPVKGGEAWQLAGGLWKHVGGSGSAPEPRLRTRVSVGGGRVTLSALVPDEALPAAPAKGAVWRCAVALHAVSPGAVTLDGGWPRLKDDGLLAGPKSWGKLVFE